MIGIQRPIGARQCRIQLQAPGPRVPDGDGEYTQTWSDLVPAYLFASLEPATAGSIERLAANTIAATASHLITIPFHAQVTTHCRVLYDDQWAGRVRTFNISNVTNPAEDHRQLVLGCEEVVP